MKNIQEETAKLLLESSKRLAKYVASVSFEFWQRKDFRLYTNFAKLSQTEQDRIFNELEVTILGLFVLRFDYALGFTDDAFKPVIKTMRREIVESFIMMFVELGVEKKYVDIWRKLIDMRLKEYREDLKIAMKESEDMPEFKGDEVLRSTWARVETITIDCLTHIRRGNVEEGDPLWKLLRKWVMVQDARLNELVELNRKV
jgi:hypothetical protein